MDPKQDFEGQVIPSKDMNFYMFNNLKLGGNHERI